MALGELDDRGRILGGEVMDIVGRNRRHIQVARDVQLTLQATPLLLQPIVLHLQIETVRAEDVAVFSSNFASAPMLTGKKQVAYLRTRAAAQRDEPVGMLGKQLFVYARPIVKAVKKRDGCQLDKVGIAGPIFGEERKVETGITTRGAARLLFQVALRRDVGLAADDRLHRVIECLPVELYSAVEVAVVGEGEAIHAVMVGGFGEPFNLASPVEQAVVAVHVQVYEFRPRHAISPCSRDYVR